MDQKRLTNINLLPCYVCVNLQCVLRDYDLHITSSSDRLTVECLVPNHVALFGEVDETLTRYHYRRHCRLYLVLKPQFFLFPDHHDRPSTSICSYHHAALFHEVFPHKPLKDKHTQHLAFYTNPKKQNRCLSTKFTKAEH